MSRPIVFIYNDKPISFKELDYIIRGECVKYVKSPGIEIPVEIIDEIVRYITKGSTFKAILQSCKRLYELNKQHIPKYCNHLWTLIENNIPEKKLTREDWYNITINPNTTLKHIKQFANEYVKNNKKIGKCTYKLSIDCLCQNPNITINEVKTLFPKLMGEKLYNKSYIWAHLSSNPGIIMQNIEDNLHLPWDWGEISLNLNVTIDFVLKHIDKNWNMRYMSSNISITESDVERTLDIIDWSPYHLVYNQNFTMKFITKHFPDHSKHSYIDYKLFTPNQIDDCLQKLSPDDQIMNDLSLNNNITIDLVLKYKHLKWDWDALSCNSGIKLSDIDNHPKLPWNWNNISNNSNLTAQYVINCLKKKWNWHMITSNNFNCSNNITLPNYM